MTRFNLAGHFVDRNLEQGRGDRVALHCGERAITYAELAALVNRAGHALRELGVRRGERVLLALSDGVEFVASWYGAQKIGAVTAEVYTFLQAKDYAYYVDYTRARVVIVDAVTLERMREAAPGVRLLVVGVPEEELRAGEASFDALTAAAPAELASAPTTLDDVAIWKFTTGSTGRPKACVHPARSALESFERYARGVLDMRREDVVLPVPKLFFGYARDLTALYPFGVGGAGIVFSERTTPELLFALIERHRPTILVNVPTMMRAMVEHPETDLSCLRACTSAGEALPEELHRAWDDAFGVEVLDGIGSSEAYHIYVSNRPGQVRHGSVGRAVPGYEPRVVDDAGRELSDGEVGRLWVKGPTTALMYYDDPRKSAETFAGDVVMSGDLFARDADGFFHYQGRADDLLKVSGVWVAPAEIERCLLGHEDVAECAVVGYEEDGLVRPRAFVVTRAEVSEESLREHVRAGLSPHKRPREIRFVDELPRTGSGKIDRRALRDRDPGGTRA